MAVLVYAAHDPGGANMLAATVDRARSRGHDIRFLGAGPTVPRWRQAGYEVTEIGAACGLGQAIGDAPDAVVTGTGFGDFERTCWQWARAHLCPALAMIDSWTNFGRRFEVPAGFDFPDAVGVIDEVAEARLRAETATEAAIIRIGQPHLQAQAARLSAARNAIRRGGEGRAIVFFSEPITEDFAPGSRGFDQFSVFAALVGALQGRPDVSLSVKPHPRESDARWRSVVEACRARTGLDVTLSTAATDRLLTGADGVCGMTTMVLLEAHVLGVPVLSLQPGRTGSVNPVIDELGEPVLRDADTATGVAAFVGRLGQAQPVLPRFEATLRDADARAVSAIENLIRR